MLDSRAAGILTGPMARGSGALGAAVTTSLAVGLAGLTCAAPRPMTSQGCEHIPDVNDCIFIARFITDSCLRECVIKQCVAGRLLCNEDTANYCAWRRDAGKQVGGYVPPRDQSCKEALDEVKWCDLDVSSSCKAHQVVHELAHACGWHHKDGFNVPGDEGDLSCRPTIRP